MPASETILNGLTSIANDWRWLAITWHLLVAVSLALLVGGWRPCMRFVGRLLVAPLFTVSAVAWLSGNPFNGATCLLLAATLLATATRFSNTPIRLASPARVTAGIALTLFGCTYPHFVRADTWTTYLYASPFGLLPCPTLSLMIGITLLLFDDGSRLWSAPLAVGGVLYGVVGVFVLGVMLDWVLLLASLLLIAFMASSAPTRVAMPSFDTGRRTA